MMFGMKQGSAFSPPTDTPTAAARSRTCRGEGVREGTGSRGGGGGVQACQSGNPHGSSISGRQEQTWETGQGLHMGCRGGAAQASPGLRGNSTSQAAGAAHLAQQALWAAQSLWRVL
jgi:hypothetical protein